MPLHRRLPKVGFTNVFRSEFQIVNLGDLGRCDVPEITGEVLKRAGLVASASQPIKILGNGTIDKPLTVRAAAFSKSAVSKIEAAGGKTEVTK